MVGGGFPVHCFLVSLTGLWVFDRTEMDICFGRTLTENR